MGLKDYIINTGFWYFTESLDSYFRIEHIQRGNPDFYYFGVNDLKYRVYVETSSKDLHVGFEYFDGLEYKIDGIYNHLGTKEILGLFGTIKIIIKNYDFDSVLIRTDDKRKFRTYLNIAQKLKDEFEISDISHDDVCILLRKDVSNANITNNVFKYKSKP